MVVPGGSVKAQGPCESLMVTGPCPCQGATQENAGLSTASPNSEVVSGHITQQAFGSAYNSCELTGTCKAWTGCLVIEMNRGKKETQRIDVGRGWGAASSPLPSTAVSFLSLSLLLALLLFSAPSIRARTGRPDRSLFLFLITAFSFLGKRCA